MSAITIQSVFSESFLEKIDNFWGMTDRDQQLFKDRLFHSISDSGDQYESLNRPGLGLPGIVEELEAGTTDGPSESYKTVMSPRGIQNNVPFSYEFSQRDNTMVMAEALKDQRKVHDDACEFAAASLFDSANSSDLSVWGHTGGDKVSILNTAHPVQDGATQSNTEAVYRGISTGAINNIINKMASAENDVGNPRPLMPVGFVTSSWNMTKSEQVIKAAFAIENSDDVPNVMGDHGVTASGIVANPYIRNRNFWAVISNIPDAQGLIFNENIPLRTDKDYDPNRRILYHYAYQAISVGFVNWRKLYGFTM